MTQKPSRQPSPPVYRGRIVAGISFDPEVFAVIEKRRGFEPRSSFVTRMLRPALRLASEETPTDAAA